MDADGGRERVVPAAGVAIFDPRWERLLLGLHRHDGRWATFGGKVEPGESAEEAARREVWEELGVELPELEPLATFGDAPQYTVHYPGWGPTTYRVTMFVTTLAEGPVGAPDGSEITDLCWFTPGEAAAAPLAADMVDIVPCAFHRASQRHETH